MNWTQKPSLTKEKTMNEDVKTQLIRFIADMFEVEKIEDLSIKTRKQPICIARQVCMFMLMEYGEEHASIVGPAFKVDRTSANHAFKTVTNEYRTNKKFNAKLDIIIEKFFTLNALPLRV